jgi:hypothetical protein
VRWGLIGASAGLILATLGCTTASSHHSASPTPSNLGSSAISGSKGSDGGAVCRGKGGQSTYAQNGIRFEYPSCWRTAHYNDPSTMSQSMVYVSSGPTLDPCTRQGASGELRCATPIALLGPDGVLVEWSEGGFPGWTLGSQGGIPLQVGGLPAREVVNRPGSCSDIGADATVDIEVGRSVRYNFYGAVACLRGPDLPALQAEIDRVVLSVSFSYP